MAIDVEPDYPQVLTHLKRFHFHQALVSLFAIKRRLIDRRASYTVLRVQIDDALKLKLKLLLQEKVKAANRVSPYQFLSADQDEGLFGIRSGETDFSRISEEIAAKEDDLLQANNMSDLVGTWGYLIRLHIGANAAAAVYGFRKVSQAWTLKKSTAISLMFRGPVLTDLGEEKIFQIDRKMDFVGFEDTLLILNKHEFESALNFRLGMERNRDEVLADFDNIRLFKDTSPLRTKIGNNIHLLRKISLVKKNAYYKDHDYIRRLQAASKELNWPIQFDKDQIVVTEESVELVLTLLNNDRLLSPINQEFFDVEVKTKVQ